MTATNPNQKNNRIRWFASEYRDTTLPSVAFRLTAGLLMLVWIVLSGWFVARVTIVGSPDEAANRYFMTHLAQTGQYRVDTGVSAEALNYLHPRSMATQGQFLASGSFLGLVQTGAVMMKLGGAGAEKILIPMVSLAGLVAMFFVFRRFWGRWWSLFGAVLIALHPAFFEYATLPYMHNGALVALLMIAAWATLRLLEQPTVWKSILVGLSYGGALFFRPVEVLWTAPALIILLVARKLWRELIFVGIVTVLVQLPWLLINKEIYGSYLSSGYTPSGVFSDAVGGEAVTAPLKKIFTPPGGEWSWHWLSSTWWYFILFLPTWPAAALVAISRYFHRKYVSWSKSLKLSVISLIGIFPLIYYGTWNLYPTTPAADVGALASYVRYWLPLYIVMAPGVIIVLRFIQRRAVYISVAAILLIAQASTIWLHPVSGLRARLHANTKNENIRRQVVAVTESNAIIIAGHADKYFQQDRLSGFRLPQNEGEWKILQTVVNQRPVYLYVAVGAVDTAQAATTMADFQLQMEKVLTINRETLWKITSTS